MAEKGTENTAPKEEPLASDDESSSQSSEQENNIDGMLQRLLARFGIRVAEEEKEKPEQLLEEVTFEGVAKFLKTEKCKNVVVMTGAGVSTAAGIPDFRSPGTGLYDNLQKYNLPCPQAVFEIAYFKANPEPFYKLAKEIYPGSFKPTVTHYFIKLLEEKDLLLRIYTQNIDTLERRAGISDERIVEAHGTFHTAHCLDCRMEYSQEFVKDEVFQDRIPKCTSCEGLVKPDIVFFGESLPKKFISHSSQDMSKCDLLIVMGTSLVVQPFASLIGRVPDTTPRLLINREKAGVRGDMMMFFGSADRFCFDDKDNYRDVAWLGNTDDGCLALADLLGWKDELLSMVKEAHKRIDGADKATAVQTLPKGTVSDNKTGETDKTKTQQTSVDEVSEKLSKTSLGDDSQTKQNQNNEES